MDSLGFIIPLSIVSLIAVIIAVVALMVIRSRAGQPVELSFLTLVVGYFYCVLIITTIVVAFGLSTLLKAGLSDVFGREFSYGSPPMARPALPPGERGPVEGRVPTPEEQYERQLQERENQYRDDLIEGITMSVVGGIIWMAHFLGRRRVREADDPTQPFLNRAYLTGMLAIFTIVSIISLPQSLYELLRYYLIPVDEFYYRQGPGGSLGIALVFVPLWIIGLTAFLRQAAKEPR